MSDSVTPWTVAHQAPLSMGFPRQEHWSGFPFPSPGDLPDPGIKPESPALQADSFFFLQADSLLSETPGKPLHPEDSLSSVVQGVSTSPRVSEFNFKCV